jgi:3-hydroxyisobutyrate dehydrogenase-like beta-hydroxyacid dehydrogenase
LLANCRDGQIVIDMTTASPASSRKIAADLATKGTIFLDAGVSGGAPSAGNGTLIVMVGGDANALAKVDDVLAPLVKIVHHMGASGTGHTAKLINNFLNGVSLSATAEAMVVAKQAGLDLKQMLDVLNASSGMNFATVNRFPRIIEGDYLEGGLSGALMEKDMHLYVELARDMGVPALNAHGSIATFQVANGLGYIDKISNRVVDAIGEYSGGVSIND